MAELAQLLAGSAAASPFPKDFSKGDRAASSLVEDQSVWPALAIVRGGPLAGELGDIARCWYEHRGSPVSALSFRRDILETEWVCATGSFNLLWQRRAAARHGHGGLVRDGEISCRQRHERASVTPYRPPLRPRPATGKLWPSAMQLLLLILALVISTAPATHAEKRVALVIGNAAYRNVTALLNPRIPRVKGYERANVCPTSAPS
jgi:hypothetical protein